MEKKLRKKHKCFIELFLLNPDYYWGICIECGLVIEGIRENHFGKWKWSRNFFSFKGRKSKLNKIKT